MNDFFDRIFCLNLDSRPERWENVCTELAKHNLEVERISAIDGKKCQKPPDIKIKDGAYGSLLSQFFILKYAQHLGLKNFLFLEDDVEFHEDINNYFNHVKNEIPDDWDMLYLGGNHYPGQNLEKITEHVYRCECTISIHAVAFNAKIFETMIHKITDISQNVDIHYALSQSNINAYVAIPHLAWQKAGYSDIEEEHRDYYWLKQHSYGDLL